MKKLVTLILSFTVLAGCSSNNAGEKRNADPEFVKVKNSYIQDVDRKSGQEISRHLVDLANRTPNVNDAVAVVLGRYAIVGIDVDANMERSQVDTTKYSVAESLKKDPHGARAIVIADPDTTARLREISQDINNGRPFQGIVNELADITGRLMPEVPGDIIKPNPRNGMEQPKKTLNKDQRKQLERRQEKESYQQK